MFKLAYLSIRSTATDGDSLFIRGALYFNCPAITSEVVKLPKEKIIIKYRNVNDLYYHLSKSYLLEVKYFFNILRQISFIN